MSHITVRRDSRPEPPVPPASGGSHQKPARVFTASYGQAILYHFSGLERQVLVLIAAMPSAVLEPVFAVRYKCDGELPSTVTFINILLGAVGIPTVFWLLGR